MRIKFEKGMMPERVAQAFVDYIRRENIIIGTVNMYIQTYGDDMKAASFEDDENMIVCKPSEYAKQEYRDDVVQIRRGKIKAV